MKWESILLGMSFRYVTTNDSIIFPHNKKVIKNSQSERALQYLLIGNDTLLLIGTGIDTLSRLSEELGKRLIKNILSGSKEEELIFPIKKACNSMLKENHFNSKLFLSLKQIETDNCRYRLNSSYYFEADSLWYAKIINDNFYVSMNDDPRSSDTLFNLSDTIGSVRTIKTKIPNWKEGKSNEKITRKVKVELVDKILAKDTTCFVFKFYQFAFIDSVGKELDVLVFFSLKNGFIGSYLFDSAYPFQIVQREGDILTDFIDYSSYSFMRIR